MFNALCQIAYSEIELETWESDSVTEAPEDEGVSDAFDEFQDMKTANAFLAGIAATLVSGVDWRTSSSLSLAPEEKQAQAAYRGSSGYSLLQSKCLEALQASKNKLVAESAGAAVKLLTR